jgi:uncharacterized membrane protein|tara:strand:- start:66372 stop:66746 length:375 start_codon:yes stop_codon:yes gene_type:complete
VTLGLRSSAELLTWLSWSALLLQQTVDAWQSQAPVFIWAVKLLPLMMFLPGMLRDNLRSYIWLCFICLGYFLVLVQRVFAQPDSLLVISGLVAVVVLFNAAMLYVRWRALELRSLAAVEKNLGD